MKPENTILLFAAGAGLIALRNRTAKVGAIYKEIPEEFYPCKDGTYSDQILQLLQNDYGYLNRLRVELTAWQQKKASIVNQGANAPSLFAISGVRRNTGTLKHTVGFL
jgi:hypothetical protein